VSAVSYTVHQGCVYVFEQQDGTWQRTQRLESAYNTARAFGRTLLFQDGRLFIGDALDIHQGSTTGAIYVYEQIDGMWQEQARIESDVARQGDYFGDHIALAGPYLVAAARTRAGSGSSGQVYLFEETDNSWTKVQDLPRPDLQGIRHFYGYNLAFNKGFLYVSASGDNEYEEGAGAIFVYRLDNLNPAPTTPELTTLSSGTRLDLTGDPTQVIP
jgi:hypothetical protein